MPEASVRDYLAAELTLPAGWRVIPEQRMPATIAQTTVVLKHTRIEPLAEASIGHVRNAVTLTVVDPHEDQTKAENDLDDDVLTVITALDGHSRISWSEAEKVLVGAYLGWDITLTVITSKPPTTEEP